MLKREIDEEAKYLADRKKRAHSGNELFDHLVISVSTLPFRFRNTSNSPLYSLPSAYDQLLQMFSD